MPLREIENISALRELVGQEVGVSDWMEVTQERINLFSEATGDWQWIHTDVDRARTESPYGVTVAHGFLTLSLMGTLMATAIRFRSPSRMGINYGLNRVRFPAPVKTGSRIRGRFTLQSFEDISGGHQFTWSVVVECEGSEKPCCVAEWIGRRYE